MICKTRHIQDWSYTRQVIHKTGHMQDWLRRYAHGLGTWLRTTMGMMIGGDDGDDDDDDGEDGDG